MTNKVREWSVPEQPKDVTRVSDFQGGVWALEAGEYGGGTWRNHEYNEVLIWSDLLVDYGPVKEVNKPDFQTLLSILQSRKTREEKAGEILSLMEDYYGENN